MADSTYADPLAGSESDPISYNFLLVVRKIVDFIVFVSKLSYPIIKAILLADMDRQKQTSFHDKIITLSELIWFCEKIYMYIQQEMNNRK
jgi:hypothetical protein